MSIQHLVLQDPDRIFPVKKSQISNTENDIIIIIRKALCDIQVLFILHYSC